MYVFKTRATKRGKIHLGIRGFNLSLCGTFYINSKEIDESLQSEEVEVDCKRCKKEYERIESQKGVIKMVGQMFDVICKQQNIALDTEVATIDEFTFVDFVIGLEDLLDIKVDPQNLNTFVYIRDLRNYFEHMAIERSLLCAKVY